MLENRRKTIIIFIFTIGVIYLLRLLYLQVIDDKYQSLGSTNAIRREIEIPLRGQIYDRNKNLLVANVEVYDMYVTPIKVKKIDTMAFCNLFKITKSYFDSTLTSAKDFSKNRASLFLRQLSKEDLAQVADAMVNYPGFTFSQSFFRTYPAHTMANALGYIGEIPKKKFDEQEDKYYRKGDYIGLSGLEKSYELELRGTRGVKFTLMNVKGEDKGSYANGTYDTLSVIGKNLYTAIDLELQQLSDSLFKGKVGSIVAIEPSTGEILALGSYPTYDPSILSGKNFSKNYASLSLNLDKPLINRATNSFYRPGSTFKLVQAVIGLHLGVITAKSSSFLGNSAPVKCHGHGAAHMSNITNAIQGSCNPYFYNLYRRIISLPAKSSPFLTARAGLTQWRDLAEKFGFGIKLGIDIPGEKKGLLPDLDLYDKYYGKNQWKFSNIYSLSIGEGELGVNVLKLANLSAVLANRGYYIAPHLVRGLGKPVGGIKNEYRVRHETGIPRKHFETIMNGMENVVKAGTARSAFIPDIPICGKTGTSQNKKGKDHAIFVGFAPRNNPKIAIAVVVENGIWGGTSAAPIASVLIEKYIKRKIERVGFMNQIINTRYTSYARANARPVLKPAQNNTVKTQEN